MTRRRFHHCQNEKCNRRLGELLERPDNPPPAGPEFCEACLAMRERGWEDGLEEGKREGLSVGRQQAGWTAAAVVVILAAIAGALVVQF